MDMPSAMPDEVKEQIIDLIGCKEEDILAISAKTGEGIEDVFDAIINRIRPPKGDVNQPLQALIFDSVFNSFRGIIAYFRIFNGQIKTGDLVKFVSTSKEYHADEISVLHLNPEPRKMLQAGDVGYIISGIKVAKEVSVGDTITHVQNPCNESIAGFKEVKSMVFAGIYPVDADDYEE
jgi:GTP-binding protein LepA